MISTFNITLNSSRGFICTINNIGMKPCASEAKGEKGKVGHIKMLALYIRCLLAGSRGGNGYDIKILRTPQMINRVMNLQIALD